MSKNADNWTVAVTHPGLWGAFSGSACRRLARAHKRAGKAGLGWPADTSEQNTVLGHILSKRCHWRWCGSLFLLVFKLSVKTKLKKYHSSPKYMLSDGYFVCYPQLSTREQVWNHTVHILRTPLKEGKQCLHNPDGGPPPFLVTSLIPHSRGLELTVPENCIWQWMLSSYSTTEKLTMLYLIPTTEMLLYKNNNKMTIVLECLSARHWARSFTCVISFLRLCTHQ